MTSDGAIDSLPSSREREEGGVARLVPTKPAGSSPSERSLFDGGTGR